VADHVPEAVAVQVDIWSDVVCPWCAIGRVRLRKAADMAGIPVRIIHHAFELRPDETERRPTLEVLGERYGGRERARGMTLRVRELAALDGLTLRTDEALSANTFDAHRLVAWAQRLGKGDEMLEALMRVHFTDLKDLNDAATLRHVAEAVGLDGQAAEEVLSGGRYATEVRADEQAARELGISGVPFFVLDGRLGVSGAQAIEVFVAALRQASQGG